MRIPQQLYAAGVLVSKGIFSLVHFMHDCTAVDFFWSAVVLLLGCSEYMACKRNPMGIKYWQLVL